MIPASLCARIMSPSEAAAQRESFARGNQNCSTNHYRRGPTGETREVDSAFSVDQRGDTWVLDWASFGTIDICPAEWPMGQAIDAAMEFMDRYRENNQPRWVSSASDLMRFCSGEARRQR